MNLLEKNLKALSAKNASCAECIQKAGAKAAFTVETSKSGQPVPKSGGAWMHSSYHPEEEGLKFAEVNHVVDGADLVVFGFGFGYHLDPAVHMAANVTVIEPDPAMLMAALAARNLAGLLEKITLVSPEDFASIAGGLDYNKTIWLDHEPSARLHRRERDILFEQFYARQAACRLRLRVLVAGPVYGGSVPTAVSAARALRELGFTVDFVDNTVHSAELGSIAEVTPDAHHQAVLKTLFNNYLGERIAARAEHFKPDVIVVMAQAPLAPQLLDRLREGLKIPVVFWFVENHRAIPYWSAVAPHYDYFFAMQKGEFLDKLVKAGAPYAAYLPQAADVSVHHPARLSAEDVKKYGSPLSFMGAGYPNRKSFFNGLLDTPLALWGTEWDLHTPLGQRVKNANRRLSPEEYAKIFLASDINLNLHSSTTHTGIDPLRDFVNPRTFEIAACGSFQLVDMRDELPEMFVIGEELATFDSEEELREKIAHYLARPDERRKIAEAGMRRVNFEHTFVNRMASMMSVVIPREEGRIMEARARRKGINDVDSLLARTQDAQLAGFLEKFRGQGNLSLTNVMDSIAKGDGPLSRPEAIFVMIDQILSQG
ncbi:MAG: glycosyltransferase [Nitrospinae bacterium]|nr:glycosyltransferase [Nitrospinota bacterium]